MSEMRNEATAAAGAAVAIVGYGTAGVNAAIALRNAGYKGAIHAFSDTNTLPYSPILTSYYAGGRKTYEECFPWSEAELAELDVSLHAESPVVALDVAAHTVRTAAGEEFPYAKCLVAVGARPTTAGFPAVEGYEPLVLRTLEAGERMKAAFARPDCTRVLVSGASMIALKSVEAALDCGLSVELVGMNSHILDMSALPVAAKRFERGLRAQGVALRFGETMQAVEVVPRADGAAGTELAVTFSGGETERFDEIVVAHGVRSDLSFIPEGALAVDRAIVVDDFMRTSDADVYAAGDCAQARELISGEKRVIGIWKAAAVQGACAGTAIAAELAGREPSPADAYPGGLVMNTIAVNGTLFIAAGESHAAEGRRVEVRETDTMTVASIFAPTAEGGERLVGFNVASDVDEPGGVAYDTAAMLTLRIEEACR